MTFITSTVPMVTQTPHWDSELSNPQVFFIKTSGNLNQYSQLSLCRHPATYTGTRYTDSRYYGLTATFCKYHIFSVWGLDNADTMNFSCNITVENCCLIASVLQYLQNNL